MKELCNGNLNGSLHKLIYFSEKIGREGHFVDKRGTFSLSAKSWGHVHTVPPGFYVTVFIRNGRRTIFISCSALLLESFWYLVSLIFS